MRRAKIYMTDIRQGDRISRTREGEMTSVYRTRKIDWETYEISTTSGSTDTVREVPFTRMFWIEIP